MNTGLCTANGITYEALAFSTLPAVEIQTLRGVLKCPECLADAFFRGRSVDGRSPCFGAMHRDDCSLATVGGGGWGDGGEGERPQVDNVGNPIRIDLAVGGADDPVVAGAAAGERRRGRGRRFGSDGAGRNAHPTRRLRPLLQALVDTDFCQSDGLIEPPDRQAMLIREFFVRTEDVRARGVIGEFRGLFGKIRTVRQPNDGVWLNTGGRSDLSFVMSPDKFQEMMDRFGFATSEELHDAEILVLGRCELSLSQPPKLYCAIPNIDYMTLRRPRA